MKIGVTEVPGTSLKMKLKVSDPFKKRKCESEDCISVSVDYWTSNQLLIKLVQGR